MEDSALEKAAMTPKTPTAVQMECQTDGPHQFVESDIGAVDSAARPSLITAAAVAKPAIAVSTPMPAPTNQSKILWAAYEPS